MPDTLSLLRAAAFAPAFHILSGAKPTDVHISEIRHSYEDYLYRTPIK